MVVLIYFMHQLKRKTTYLHCVVPTEALMHRNLLLYSSNTLIYSISGSNINDRFPTILNIISFLQLSFNS